MRPLAFTVLVFVTSISRAQLVNDSFESNGAFSANSWEWTCEAPTSVTLPPIGGGDWSARKEMGNWKGCMLSYLFQRIPFTQNGQVWRVSAWLRSDTIGVISQPRVGLASLHNGLFTVGPTNGASGFDWTYVYVNDTVHSSAVDTAVVLLNSGTTAGPAYGAGWFDDITLTLMSPGVLPIEQDEHPAFRPNPARDKLWVDLPGTPIAIELYDALGARLPDPEATHSGHTLELQCASLSPGIHFLVMRTASGSKSIRFLKQ